MKRIMNNLMIIVAYPKYWNPFFYITLLILFIIGIVIATFETTTEVYNVGKEWMKDTKHRVYDWELQKWVSIAEYYDLKESRIKAADLDETISNAKKAMIKIHVPESLLWIRVNDYKQSHPNADLKECIIYSLNINGIK